MNAFPARTLLLTLATLGLAACADEPLSPETMPAAAPALSGGGAPGAVFTSTNAAAGNEVVAFRRAADGTLAPAGSHPTGGMGLGAGLSSQGAVTLTQDARYLLVVNAGSDDLSVFAVDGERLTLTDRVSSGGDRPVSVAVHHRLVYVLNAGSDGLAGFTLSADGDLSPIPGSSRALAGSGTGAAQASFNPRGDLLVVTERAANRIEAFSVGSDGRLGASTSGASAGATPFGFAFQGNGTVVVSEANGGTPLGGLVSSYAVSSGAVTTITGALPNGETAPCWLLVSPDHRHAFVANAGTASVSSYAVASDGSLALLQGAAGSTAAGPLDMAFSRDGRYLYAVTPRAGTVSGFAVSSDGGLTPVGAAGALPASAYGLAAM